VGRVPVVVAAVCPHPPMLLPEVASGAAPELDTARTACANVVAELLAAGPDRLIVVGAGPAPSGVEVGRPDLPLSLAIGEWLLGPDQAPQLHQIATDAPPETCAAEGRALAAAPERIALLVMGDGSACRGPKSPGYDDPRAEGFDRAVADALAGADVDALLAVDPDLARELRCAGRAPWQVLAGALSASANGQSANGQSANGQSANGQRWRGEVYYNEAPYGVAYFVAIMRLSS
jgi:hypothetical protein